MYDANDLTKLIKTISVNANDATKPVNLCFGTVIKASPLEIKIDQKLILTKEQLILTKNVTNYSTTINLIGDVKQANLSINETVEDTQLSVDLTHSHNINSTFKATVNNQLKQNDQVILVRVQGGQKYLVLDRIGG